MDVPLHGMDGQSVAFAPESTVEPRGRGGGAGADSTLSQRVISEAKLYLDPPIDYTSQDQFTARGTRFEVEGESMGGWDNPYTGNGYGQEILLRRVTG